MGRGAGFLLLFCFLAAVAVIGEGSSQTRGGGMVAVETGPADQPKASKPDPNDSMEKLLHWAIENSDHQALRDSAAQSREERLQQNPQGQAEAETQPSEKVLDGQGDALKGRMMEHNNIRQSMNPSETELIQEVVSMLNSEPGLSVEEAKHALEALQILVEPIDNANNMKVLGAIPPVVERLEAEESSLRAMAAFVIGTAASNNPDFQNDLVELYPDIMFRLRQLLLDSEDEVCNKALYAIGALVRNQKKLSHDFLSGGGMGYLEALMSAPRNSQSQELRIKRKALSVAMDILEVDNNLVSLFLGGDFPTALLQLLHTSDIDLQEKALSALHALVSMGHPPVMLTFKAHHAEDKLLKLQSHLTGAMQASVDQEDGGDAYLTDVLHLCSSVLGMMAEMRVEPGTPLGLQV